MRKRLLAIALAATSASASFRAAAQDAPRAEVLFQEARALVEKGRYAEACPKLQESQRLDPAVGTLFNLADCYEHVEQTATAYFLFREVASIARSAGKFERDKSARERMAKLEPRLARFKIVVKADAPGLEVLIDGTLIERARWSEPMPVDPGPHRIAARAPDRIAYKADAEAIAAQTTELEIPELVDPTPKKPLVVVAAPKPSRVVPVTIGAIGLVGVGVGAVFGGLALGSKSDAQRDCPKEIYSFRCPTEDGARAWNDATDQGNVSTVAFIVGGVALATAAALWIIAPGSRTRAAASANGMLIGGSF